MVYRGSQALGIGDIYNGRITVPCGVSGVVVVAVVVDVDCADKVLFLEEEVLVVLEAVFNVECVDEVLLAEVVVVVVFNVECVDEVLFTEVVLVVFGVECVDKVLFTDDDEEVVVLCLRDAAVAAKTTRNINKRESNMLKNKTPDFKS